MIPNQDKGLIRKSSAIIPNAISNVISRDVPDIRPTGYLAGLILGARFTGYIKYSNNKFLLQHWEIN